MATPRTFGHQVADLVYAPRPASYAVVLSDSHQVAWVVAESGLFLPGGATEPGESAEDAVRREVREECARELDLLASLPSAIQYFTTPSGRAYELRASFFVGRFGPFVSTSAEHEVTWLPAASMSTDIYHECHTWAIRQALSHADA